MKYQITFISTVVLLFTGCNEIPQIPQPHVPHNKSNFVTPQDNNLSKPIDQNATTRVQQTIPKKPKKNIKLKTVEDKNFSPDYMYPSTPTPKVQKKTVVSAPKTTKASTMSKDECISMIGQERFDRYVQMLGSQNDAIKRCQLIKSQS